MGLAVSVAFNYFTSSQSPQSLMVSVQTMLNLSMRHGKTETEYTSCWMRLIKKDLLHELLSVNLLAVCHPPSLWRGVGIVAVQPQTRGCWMSVEKVGKRVGLIDVMVWKWVSWGGYQHLSMSAHTPIPCVWGTISCVSKPVSETCFLLVILPFYTELMLFYLWGSTSRFHSFDEVIINKATPPGLRP